MGDCSKLPAEHPVHALKALHKELGDQIAEKEAAMAPPVDDEPELDDNADPGLMKRDAIAKAERLELTKRIEAAEKRATDAETIAKGELEKREVGELRVQLAKFRNLTIDVDKEVADFRAIQKADPKAFGLLITKLAAADAVAKKGDALMRELGSGAAGTGGDAWAEIEQLAKKVVEKSDKPMTIEKAIEKVMADKANFGLVQRYEAENKTAAN
jgi:hypothetical protein